MLFRSILRRIVTPLVALAIAYLLVRLALDGTTSGLGTAAAGGIGLMAAIDLVVANFASWQPLVPDYSRYTASPRRAALGVGAGFAVASTVTFAVGILAAVQAGGIDSASAGVAVMLAVPLGTIAAAVLVVDEADKGFANIYSTAVSIRNLAPNAGVPFKANIIGTAPVASAKLMKLEGEKE